MTANIKNYTSSVPVDRSVQLIEAELVEAGACNIMKVYEGGKLKAITFQLHKPGDNCNLVPIRLPAETEKVLEFFKKHMKGKVPEWKLEEQAERTAWKTLLEWVQIQMGMIKMDRVDALQVFLGYVWLNDQTYYQQLKTSNFLQLENK